MLDIGLSLFVCLLQVCESLFLKFPIHQNQNKTYPGFEHELTRRDLWGNVEISPGERGRCGRWRSFIKWDDILINYMGESLHNVYRYQITTAHTLLSQLNKGEIKQNHWLTGWFTVSVSAPARSCALSTVVHSGTVGPEQCRWSHTWIQSHSTRRSTLSTTCIYTQCITPGHILLCSWISSSMKQGA